MDFKSWVVETVNALLEEIESLQKRITELEASKDVQSDRK